MIAGLNGTLEAKTTDGAIINVGGVSFRVSMPASTLGTLGAIGEEVHLHTHLVVREDGIALYGFASTEEVELFRTLIGVAGVGPKVALSMLSAMSPSDLSLAIVTGNVDFLAQVPGVGRKMASRITLELKGKLERVWVSAAAMPEGNAEVIAALTTLGYSPSEVASSVAALPDSPELSVEERIKLALQHLAAR